MRAQLVSGQHLFLNISTVVHISLPPPQILLQDEIEIEKIKCSGCVWKWSCTASFNPLFRRDAFNSSSHRQSVTIYASIKSPLLCYQRKCSYGRNIIQTIWLREIWLCLLRKNPSVWEFLMLLTNCRSSQNLIMTEQTKITRNGTHWTFLMADSRNSNVH